MKKSNFNSSNSTVRLWIEGELTRLGFGMRGKLILLFIVIKVIPLLLLTWVAWNQSSILGAEMQNSITALTQRTRDILVQGGSIAVADAVLALDERARDDIERMTADTAFRIATFLYDRDNDIRTAAILPQNSSAYALFLKSRTGRLIEPSEWELAPGGSAWQLAKGEKKETGAGNIVSSNRENSFNFHYRQATSFAYESRPLFLEITLLDLNGKEILKETTSPLMNPTLRDISQQKNTFAQSESYFEELKNLRQGEIYVSTVIGEYVGSRVLGAYTPASAAQAGEAFAPEKSAYASDENPLGKRFKGIVRWATPVEHNGVITGYVTLVLDHDHLMEFTAHISPTQENYLLKPSVFDASAAAMWDYKGRNIAHPRHAFIVGYDAATGKPQVPWLDSELYAAWKASGKDYADFIEDSPTFSDQSTAKHPAKESSQKGQVGLDCRYLNFAPQCTGWFDLTQKGGLGSFTLLWGNSWKVSSAAAIPYYTGQYANSSRGFGIVSVSAALEEFHRPAIETKKKIDTFISKTEQSLHGSMLESHSLIGKHIFHTALSLSAATVIMILVIILMAIAVASMFTSSILNLTAGIARFRSGERQFRFHSPLKDEIGTLADAFDDMADELVDSVTALLAIIDLDYKVIYMNDVSLLSRGNIPLEELVGKPYQESRFFPWGSRYCPIRALKEGTTAEVWYNKGNNRYYQGSASLLLNKNGESIGYIIAGTDITEMALRQKKIEEQRAFLDTILSQSPDFIWYKDLSGIYLAANLRFAAIVGKNVEEIVGQADTLILPPHILAEDEARESEVLRSKEVSFAEERIVFADGHSEIHEVVRTPVYNANGDIVGILGVGRDVSTRVTVEHELRKTQNELEVAVVTANRASASKSEFLARMSHEIRTPMNAIIGMTKITKRKLEACTSIVLPEVVEHVTQIEVSAQHLLGLLNDILDISKIEAGKIELGNEAFNLTKLIESVVAIITPRCVEKNITFVTHSESLTWDFFRSDPLRLRQVLINLLGNAAKFTPECGTITFTVEQLAMNNGKMQFRFAVEDTGIGIAKSVLPQLFTPFEQGASSITQNYGGTGLGLSISRSIVRLLGGDISVTSELGHGSCFAFTLWIDEELTPVSEALECSTPASLQGKRLLLVDDVNINRIIVVELLNETGLLIDEAGDGEEALAIFSASDPFYYDMIIMDVQMPKMSGYETAQAIRSLQRSDATVPIVAMTANAFKEDVDTALASGMNNHLAKPLELDKLMAMLHMYMSQQ